MTTRFGSHLGRIQNLDIESTINSPKSKLSLSQFREKRWCYIGIVHPELILGCALVHLGYAANAFCFVYDRKQNKMVERGFVLSPFSGLIFDRNPDQGRCEFESKGSHIKMLHDIKQGKRILDIKLPHSGNKTIKAEIEIFEKENSEALQLLTPMTVKGIQGRKVFTQKIAGLSAQGNIEADSNKFSLDKEKSYALFDWTNGFHDRKTEWNWACAGGVSECGKNIGFNFSRGVYKMGFLENIVWVDGKAILLDEIFFKYDKNNPMQSWHIANQNKSIDLHFQCEGKRQAKDNFGLVASHFTQVCGSFSGSIKDLDGNSINIENVAGVVEDHFALW